MRRTFFSAALLVALAACASPIEPEPRKEIPVVMFAFDEFGYNEDAWLFNGLADGVDRILDGTYFGNATYALDHLKMKWNREWDRGNAENWNNPPYAAHIDNVWNGQAPGGSGEVWHYRIKWYGPCGFDGTPIAEGGYCIWGQFQVLMSHGTANGHFWDTHATPAGFGN